jgi:hypothetical protein
MLKNYDILYKRNSEGTIQFWHLQTSDGPFPFIEKWSGQLGTDKPLHHSEQITEGKQKRTPLEQANAQALSDWKRKKDKGYKTAADLGLVPFPGDHNDLWLVPGNPTGRMLATALEEVLPRFNTDATGNVLPQLAPTKLWVASPKNEYPVLGEIKYDGNRTTIVTAPTDTYALTRTGKPQTNLDHLIAIIDAVFPRAKRTKTEILDGEVYLHGLPLEEINEAIRKKNENTEKLQFYVYDIPSSPEVQSDRSYLCKLIVEHFDSPFFVHIPPVVLNSDEEVLTFLQECEDKGYEGAIVKLPHGTYKPGTRNNDWRKVKRFEDHEYTIVGHQLGQRGAQDLKFICTCEGGEFEVTMNGTIQTKERLVAELDTLMGMQLTVRHKGLTKYKIPNHAKGVAIRRDL